MFEINGQITIRTLSKTLLMLVLGLHLVVIGLGQDNRGVGIRVKGANGQISEIKLYDGSYSLVIGESKYQFWDTLPGVKSDVEAVSKALTHNGFTVKTGMNLTSQQLTERINQFISDYGFGKNNRLLIYFAGHGHTQKALDGRDLGYIIPTDTPLPEKDDIGFRRKAISLDTIQNYARQIEAKHALFIFDSCFSGKLISRENITLPPAILEDVTYPVRQFITAGAANQVVLDDSIFRRAFVRGLNGEADRNGDGYITGSELAAYLKEKVTNSSNRTQTPQYGKIRDIDLERGDFVFVVPNAGSVATSKPTPMPLPTPIPTPLPTPTPISVAPPIDAEEFYWQEISKRDTKTGYESYLGEYPKGKYVAQANNKIKQFKQDELQKQKDIERSTWREAQNQNTRESYNSYLTAYPNGEFAADARLGIKALDRKEEQAKWLETQSLNSKEAYKSYLALYPYGEFASSAKSEIKEIEDKEEQTKWDEVQFLNRKSAYQSYLSVYPNGKYEANARQKIKEFDDEEARKLKEQEKAKERTKWEEAERLKTIEAYDGYLTSYPNGDYASLARLRLSNMGISRSPVEETDWQEINSRGMRADYERYLSKYPDGKYTSTARQKIKELDDEEKKEERRKELEKVNELLRPIENDFNNRRYTQVIQATIPLLQNVSVRHGRINFLLGMSYWNTGDFGKSVLPLSHSIEDGETVTVMAKRFAFASTGDVNNSLVEGKLVLKKGSLEFIIFWTGGPNRGEVYSSLSVPASKIYELEYGDFMFQISIPTPHIRIKIGVPKGNNNSKEDKINYNFQPTGATMISCQGGRWCVTCSGCQEEAKAIYGLILNLKNGQ